MKTGEHCASCAASVGRVGSSCDPPLSVGGDDRDQSRRPGAVLATLSGGCSSHDANPSPPGGAINAPASAVVGVGATSECDALNAASVGRGYSVGDPPTSVGGGDRGQPCRFTVRWHHWVKFAVAVVAVCRWGHFPARPSGLGFYGLGRGGGATVFNLSLKSEGNTRPYGRGMRTAHTTFGSSDVASSLGGDDLGPSVLVSGVFGGHGAGSTTAEVAFGLVGLEYDGAHSAVPSIAPRGVDTRPHGHGTRAAHATSGRSSDVAPAPGGDALGLSALGRARPIP